MLVLMPMALEHGIDRRFELGGLALEIGACTAAVFGGVGRKLDAVNGEHLPSDESLTIAEPEDTGKNGLDVFAEQTDETGDGGEVRLAVAA